MFSLSDPAALRRTAYHLLIVVAVAGACGRIVSAQRLYEPSLHRDASDPEDRRSKWPTTRPAPMPTFSSNDRSRWATVRALVDEGTYVIGRRDKATLYASAVAPLGQLDPLAAAALADAGYRARTGGDVGIIFEDGWQSVDKVLHPGKMEFYSSKPPLLSTLLAGLYWLLQRFTGWLSWLTGIGTGGWTLADNPFAVIYTILLLVNAVPFLLYLVLLTRLANAYGQTDWGRLFVVAAGAFATLVGPFLITLNNHTIGTFCVMFAWVALLRVWRHRADPALGPPPWPLFAVAGLFASFAVCNELPALAFAAAAFVLLVWWFPARTLLAFLPAALLPAVGFFATNYAAIQQFEPAYSEFGSPWYEYEGSHWRKPPPGQIKHGIDWAWMKENRATYALHVLFGHHGLFSLTPIWLLAVAAMLLGLIRLGRSPQPPPAAGPPFALPWFVQPLVLALTAVVVGFYLFKSDNYGGWTNGLRWLMWLTPLWLTSLLPMADLLAPRRWGRGLAYVLLAVSVFSAHYWSWNPWRMPWIYNLMLALGWEGY